MTISRAKSFAFVTIVIISSVAIFIDYDQIHKKIHPHEPTIPLDDIVEIMNDVAEYRLSNITYSNNIIKQKMVRNLMTDYRNSKPSQKQGKLDAYKQEINAQFAEICNLNC